MPGIKLQKRDKDFFVSYGHPDVAKVADIVALLDDKCGLRLWFDAIEGNAAQRSSELLSGAIRNCRGTLICLSKAWLASTWCKAEYEVSLNEQRANDGFELVCARLDDAEAPPWLQASEIIDLRQLDARGMARLLCSLASDVPHRFDNEHDVYLAVPWSRRSALARESLEVLRNVGWRLIGDAPNLMHLADDRVRAIQRTTRGVVALLPHDPTQPGSATSPYILEEAQFGLQQELPVLLLVEPGVAVPADMVQSSFRGAAFELQPSTEGRRALADHLDIFDEYLKSRPRKRAGSYIFWASSLRNDPDGAGAVSSVIERASNMECVRGVRLAEDNVQKAIIDRIRHAALVVADVSDDHRNTLIEAGIAMGTGTPLRLMCREPPAGTPLKKRFMFEGQEFFWYRNEQERLCLAYYFARQFRRRVYVVR
ncbi:toll/interleukin-1 receptor domain-containing protein [Caenimonas sedimenti]|uniref:Toll/interleukin-1 receptor domain-containing protein n=1 Tax=Caenimonas sedimenti TaxID=2596921 RepID=A0A562ZPL2_9BURK|nr:toll/interleukin-1 receptor domain-containing protein [Caenimonas sedimenti]TWO70311.1 toll/interleukin-1 receptor domain-containing protein [Caenimonas sedimenti]